MSTWADHFNTVEEACRFYGIDTPEQAAHEAAYWTQEAAIEAQDAMEARGGPTPPVLDEIPF